MFVGKGGCLCFGFFEKKKVCTKYEKKEEMEALLSPSLKGVRTGVRRRCKAALWFGPQECPLQESDLWVEARGHSSHPQERSKPQSCWKMSLGMPCNQENFWHELWQGWDGISIKGCRERPDIQIGTSPSVLVGGRGTSSQLPAGFSRRRAAPGRQPFSADGYFFLWPNKWVLL